MKRLHRFWPAVVLSLLLITTISCASLAGAPTTIPRLGLPTATGQFVGAASGNSGGLGGGNSGGTGSGNSGGTGSGNSGGTGSGNSGSATQPPPSTPEPTPTLPTVAGGPYEVKQIVSLGHETISGQVCSLTTPFVVFAVAPAASWTFNFVPQSADHGTLTYAYNIPKAGESHDAKGTYTLAQADVNGTLLLTMAVRDHVVFKGFDGAIPNKYSFKLVPTPGVTCK
jgi:hypothetical protein